MFWLKTNDSSAEILNSGQFSVLLSDGFITAHANIGSQLDPLNLSPCPLISGSTSYSHGMGNKLSLYRNNEQVVTPVNASGNLTGDPTLTIGGRKFLGDGPFEGVIDDLRIFDQALTTAQRDSVYNFVDPPLIAYFGDEYSYQIETLKVPLILTLLVCLMD